MAGSSKLCICTFRGLPFADFLQIVKANEVAYVELTCHKTGDINLSDTTKLLETNGISVAALDCGSAHELCRTQTDSDVVAAQTHTRECIRLARELRCTVAIVRLGHRSHQDTLTALRQAREYLMPCLEEAEAQGVTLVIENRFDWRNEDPTQSAIERRPESLLALMESVGSKYLKVHYDPANYHIGGLEGFPLPYEMLKPWIAYVHLKDCRRYTPLIHGTKEHYRLRTDSLNGPFQTVPTGRGALNSAGILRALIQDGYDGFITLEPHELPHKDRALIEDSLRYIRSIS